MEVGGSSRNCTSVMNSKQNENEKVIDTFYGFFFNKIVTITSRIHNISIPDTASASVHHVLGLFTENFTYLPFTKRKVQILFKVGHYNAAAEETQYKCEQNIYLKGQMLIKAPFTNNVVLESGTR